MKAMVLCAGYGTRLGELTREIPKPMLPVAGHPLLAYVLTNVRRAGFDRIMVNLHFKPEFIRGYFGDGSRGDLRLTYTYEPELLGTAGGVKNVEEFFGGEDAFLVHYGDVVTDQDFAAMVEFHRERRALVTLLLHRRAASNSVVTLDGEGRIVGFLERPTEEARAGATSPWVNSGVCVCHADLLQSIPANASCDLPRDVFTRLVDTGRLFGFPLTGYRCAVDSVKRLNEAEAALREGRCCIAPFPPPDDFKGA